MSPPAGPPGASLGITYVVVRYLIKKSHLSRKWRHEGFCYYRSQFSLNLSVTLNASVAVSPSTLTAGIGTQTGIAPICKTGDLRLVLLVVAFVLELVAS